MSVEAGGSAAFQATLQDNGNPIDAPSPFTWSTEDPTDVIMVGAGSSTAKITVQANPARTTLTASASTTDPTGATQTGSVTIDVVPGVTHTYTVGVSQIFAAPKP
jgi:hypothetical protein